MSRVGLNPAVEDEQVEQNSPPDKQQVSYAFYRLPYKHIVQVVKGTAKQVEVEDLEGEGFLFAPYNPHEKSVFIPATEKQEFPQGILLDFPDLFPSIENAIETEKDDYCRLVKFALSEISSGKTDKLVCARNFNFQLPADFKAEPFFRELCVKYPHAFVSLVSTPFCGTWMCASPELLLEAGKGRFRTMALAGTSASSKQELGEKELREQTLVAKFISDCFSSEGITFKENEPHVLEAGNLKHFRTEFEGYGNADWAGLVKLLHPTPAVSGLPKEVSMKLLLENEKLERQFYSGYLGPVENNIVQLFVNLRCMQLHSSHAVFYAGAGIVEGSVPEKEWQETENKIGTLLNVLREMYG